MDEGFAYFRWHTLYWEGIWPLNCRVNASSYCRRLWRGLQR